jgi:transitional endoplasmic reticulum ATPase
MNSETPGTADSSAGPADTQTELRRRRSIEDLILRLKLAKAEDKPRLLEELAQVEGLTAAERRQALLAAQRYVFTPRLDVSANLEGLLGTVLKLTARETWLLSLTLFRTALDGLQQEEQIGRFRALLEALLRIYLPEGSAAVFSPELFMRVGRRLEIQGRTEGLVELATIGLYFFPFHGPLRELRADYALAEGDAGRARADYEKLLEQYPEQFGYRLDAAEASMKLEDYDAALDELDAYLQRDADFPLALKKQAECLYQIGRSMEALKVYSRLVDLEPENAEHLINRARAFDSLEFMDDAQRDIERALQLDPANLDARQLKQSLAVRRQGFGGMEDDIYGAFSRGDSDAFLGDLKIPEVRFSDIGGLDRAKQLIRETIEYPLKYTEISDRYGKRAGGGLLFFGPPGCGKTLLAKAAAGECEVNFINVNLASVLDKWVGNSEKAVSMIFNTARKKAPSIIFLDEVDALGGSRSSMQSGWEKKLISQLLIELDGLTSENEKVMVLGATNAPWDVDFALRRPGRLGRMVFVPPPGLKEREEILRIYLAKRPFVAEEIDLAAIAARTERYSADALRQLVENAASIPWREAIETGEQRPIAQADLEKAIAQTQPDLAEWEKLVGRYKEFADQSLTRPGIGFTKGNLPNPV